MTDQRIIRRLRLESFKSIVKMSQELGQLTILVGENSAGKSSFIQSIVLASQLANSGADSAVVNLNSDVLTMGSFDQLVHSGAYASDQVSIGLDLAGEMLKPRWHAAHDPAEDNVSWSFSLADTRKRSGALLTRTKIEAGDSGFAFSLVDDESPDEAERDRSDGVKMLVQKALELGLDNADRELPGFAEVVTRGRAIFVGDDRTVRRSGPGRYESNRYDLVRMDGALPASFWAAKSLREAVTRSYVDMLTWGKAEFGDGGTARDNDWDLDADYLEFLENIQEQRSRDWSRPVVPMTFFEEDELSPDAVFADLMELDISSHVFVDRDHLTPVQSEAELLSNFIQDTLERRVHLLGPLREEPAASFRPGLAGSGIATIGLKGQYAVNYLDEHQSDQVLCPRIDSSPKEMSLMRAVSYWLNELEIGGRIQTKQRGRQLEYDLIDRKTKLKRDLTSVGVGASQILPVIVLCLAAKPGELVLLEQPELHLHPKPQQILGDFLLGISQTGRQLIVETHSEYLVNRLRLRMVEQDLDEQPNSLKLLYAKRDDLGATTFDEIRPNKHGLFEGGWPDGFFDQTPQEAEKIVRAAVERRRKARPDS